MTTDGANVVGYFKTTPKDELDAEAGDPYADGWVAAEACIAEWNKDMDADAPVAEKMSGTTARLWRKGFNDRVNEHIAGVRSRRGLTSEAQIIVSDLQKKSLGVLSSRTS